MKKSRHTCSSKTPMSLGKALERWLSLESIKKALEWWLRFALPVAAIILAVYSMHTSSVQLQLAQRTQEITMSHYFEIEEPSLMYQRISLDLIALDNRIDQADQSFTQYGMPEATITELEQALHEARYWREETDKALFEYRLIDADIYIGLAHENVDKVLRELSKQVLELPVVSISPGSFLYVGIDNLTTGTTKEGEPLDTVTIAMAAPPISSGYPYRVICCYEISPDGAVFDNPATFTFLYNPDDVPFGFHEEDLVLAAWDSDTEQWSVLADSRIDLRQKSISVKVNHLSYFAVIAQYPKLTQPVGWIAVTGIVLGLSFFVVFGIVAVTNRRQRTGGRALTCGVCKYQWFPRVPTPKQCPRCRSANWNK
jgi:hypothetical protein